jgi:exosortase/archaeosortase family protein
MKSGSASKQQLGGPSWLRLLLISGLASAQLTLYWRTGNANIEAFSIMAAVSWIGATMLLLGLEEQQASLPLVQIPWTRFWLGVLLVVWCLNVLSFAAQFYDPLLHGVPLMAGVGVALLAGVRLRSRLMLELAVIGALLPLQVLANRFLPSDWLASSTAQASAALLWLAGTPAVAQGHEVSLADKTLLVGASCTGLNTLMLVIAALLMVQLISGIGQQRWWRAWLRWFLALGLALVAAWAINACRVCLLAWMDPAEPQQWWQQLRSFDFWHEGWGSHLFSLVAMVLGLQCLELLLPKDST